MRFERLEILSEVREGRLCRPNSTWDVNLLQLIIESEVKLEGRPCIGNINSGQPSNVNYRKHEASVFLQQIDTRLGHPETTHNRPKDGGSPPEVEMERNSSPLSWLIRRKRHLRKLPSGMDKNELQVPSWIFKIRREGW